VQEEVTYACLVTSKHKLKSRKETQKHYKLHGANNTQCFTTQGGERITLFDLKYSNLSL